MEIEICVCEYGKGGFFLCLGADAHKFYKSDYQLILCLVIQCKLWI